MIKRAKKSKKSNYRSAVSGKYVQKDSARRRPKTTVTETKKKHKSKRASYRSAISGKYVQKATARRRPRTTVKSSPVK
jgi:hypothetical protein